MPPIQLPRKEGFPFRFGNYVGITPFLRHLQVESELASLHRSKVTLRSVREDVLQFQNNTVRPKDRRIDITLQHIADKFRLNQRVKMKHLNEIWDLPLDIWSASPGLPYKLYGYKTKQHVKDDPKARNDIRFLWHRVKTGARVTLPDCCAYVRSHLAPPGEEKVRAVWGYPIAVTMGEAIFAKPLIDAFKREHTPVAYGYETANGGTRRIVQRFRDRNHCYGLDFKSFDKNLPAWLIRAAFAVLEQNIDFVHYEGYGIANVQGVLNQWDAIIEYFINTPIRLPDGTRYRKNCGVASGSYFTQLIDSICNAFLIEYACLLLTGQFSDDLLVFGDDSVFALRKYVPMQQFNAVFESFGMRINIAKSAYSADITDLEFLGYALTNSVPTKAYSKWMASLLFPEHPDNSWDEVASRALGLYYANLGVNGRFHSICHGIVTYRGFDLVLSRDLTKMLRVAGFDVSTLHTGLPSALDLQFRFLYR